MSLVGVDTGRGEGGGFTYFEYSFLFILKVCCFKTALTHQPPSSKVKFPKYQISYYDDKETTVCN